MSIDLASSERPAVAGPSTAVRALVAQFSIETTPRQAQGVVSFAALLPAATEVYVTHLPNSAYDDVIATCRRLAAEGLRPVPHLAARSVPGRRQLDDWLGALAAAGADALLLIAGDGRPAGPFAECRAVLDSGALLRHGIRRVAVAGHPEGHPRVERAALAQALADKAAYAAETGTEMWVVTQFAFEPGVLARWLVEADGPGGRLPVRVGLAGPATPTALLGHALRCGVGASLKVLRRRPAALGRLARPWTPDRLLVALARHRDEQPGTALCGIHVFPFGNLARAAAWFGAIRDGAFRLAPDGDALLVDLPGDAPGERS